MNLFASRRARATRATRGRVDDKSNEVKRLFRTSNNLDWRWANAILGERDAATNVSHEVFQRAMNGREVFATVTSPIDLLYRLTPRLCLNRIRDRARQKRNFFVLRRSDESGRDRRAAGTSPTDDQPETGAVARGRMGRPGCRRTRIAMTADSLAGIRLESCCQLTCSIGLAECQLLSNEARPRAGASGTGL
jgi:DNA-directed RNA polymerase specialized sigma24 family protein